MAERSGEEGGRNLRSGRRCERSTVGKGMEGDEVQLIN